jgi:hypothetical protein
MRRGRREMVSVEMAARRSLIGFAEGRFCLFGQMVEWSYGYFDDRSGSDNLSESCQEMDPKPTEAPRAVPMPLSTWQTFRRFQRLVFQLDCSGAGQA